VKPAINTADIEMAIARLFCWWQNLIVPNISWGAGFRHELDLLVVSPNGYGTEIEIKVSKSDLKADANKPHEHRSVRIKRLWFAYPESIGDCAEFVPERAGIFIVKRDKCGVGVRVETLRPPKINTEARKFTPKELDKIRDLAAMRMWTLKEHLQRRRHEKEWKEMVKP